jgi:NADP-dependent 3-hydroxy acid dehydrogenase YdfG
MPDTQKTAIVTGASRGIGAGAVAAFLQRGYSVMANCRSITKSNPFAASTNLALVDGDVGDPSTAATIVDTAVSRFARIDALVNTAGIYFSKHFTDYTIDDLRSLVSANIDGFVFITQLVIARMLAQQTGGSIVNITAAQAILRIPKRATGTPSNYNNFN